MRLLQLPAVVVSGLATLPAALRRCAGGRQVGNGGVLWVERLRIAQRFIPIMAANHWGALPHTCAL